MPHKPPSYASLILVSSRHSILWSLCPLFSLSPAAKQSMLKLFRQFPIHPCFILPKIKFFWLEKWHIVEKLAFDVSLSSSCQLFFKSTLLSSLLVFTSIAFSWRFLRTGLVHAFNLVFKGQGRSLPNMCFEGSSVPGVQRCKCLDLPFWGSQDGGRGQKSKQTSQWAG